MSQLVKLNNNPNRLLRLCESHIRLIGVPLKIVGSSPEHCEHCTIDTPSFIATTPEEIEARASADYENRFLYPRSETLVIVTYTLREEYTACKVLCVPCTRQFITDGNYELKGTHAAPKLDTYYCIRCGASAF
jgi:hypothetical protein